jgi:membrane associated rhomboid family serine protease
VIPLRDDNPTRSTPVVVIAIVIINVLVFLVDKLGGAGMGREGALASLAMVPQNIINAATGTPPIPASVHPSLQPVWLTIFTSMFMHGGLMHIGGNMLFLWIFGNNIEDALGHVKFAAFYLGGGFLASMAHVLSTTAAGDPRAALVPVVGASGAIAAVLGAYFVLYPSARVICLVTLGFFWTTVALPAIVVLGYWILLEVVRVSLTAGSAAGGGIAYWAHIGGFASGGILILVMGGRRPAGRGRNSDYLKSYD